MRRAVFLSFVFFALTGGLSQSAFAHEEHCHKKDAAGTWTDVPDAKDKKACEAAGGKWKHHHEHCHKKGTDGKWTDVDAKDPKACQAAGGEWKDHGHKDDHTS